MSYLYGPSFYQAGLLFARAHTLVRGPPRNDAFYRRESRSVPSDDSHPFFFSFNVTNIPVLPVNYATVISFFLFSFLFSPSLSSFFPSRPKVFWPPADPDLYPYSVSVWIWKLWSNISKITTYTWTTDATYNIMCIIKKRSSTVTSK